MEPESLCHNRCRDPSRTTGPRPASERHAALLSPSQPCPCAPGTTEPHGSPAPTTNKLPQRPHQQGEGKRRGPGGEGSPDAHPGAVPPPRPRDGREGGAVPGTAYRRHLPLEEKERGSAGRGRQVGVLPGLGVLGGAPAARARPAGAVPAQPRAARSLPCPALPRRVSPAAGATCPGTAARALRVCLIMFLVLFRSAPGRRAGGRRAVQGGGRRGPSRAVAGAEPRRGRWVPVLAGSPAGTRGLKDRRKTCLGPVLNVCVCWGVSVLCLSSFWEWGDCCELPRTFKSLNCGIAALSGKRAPNSM